MKPKMQILIYVVASLSAIVLAVGGYVFVFHKSASIWIFFGGIVLGFLALALVLQEKVWKDNEASLKKEYAPYVSFRDIELISFEAGKIPTAKLTFKNISTDTPAFRSYVETHMSFRATKAFTGFMPPKSTEQPTKVDVMPQNEIFGWATGPVLTPEHIQAVKDTSGWLFVYGFIAYQDPLGIDHKTEYCVRYEPDVGSFGYCESNNTAK